MSTSAPIRPDLVEAAGGEENVPAYLAMEEEMKREATRRPPVYFAGPVDYVEHRGPDEHLRDNWRHRFFGDLPIDLLCPMCDAREIERNTDPGAVRDMGHLYVNRVMEANRQSMARAEFFVAFFPGDVASFGTPVEVWSWVTHAFQIDRPGRGVLIHPVRPGVLVRYLEAEGLVVVRNHLEARQWLIHGLGL